MTTSRVSQEELNFVIAYFGATKATAKVSGSEISLKICPNPEIECESKTGYNFYVNVKKKKYHCHKCGYSGSFSFDDAVKTSVTKKFTNEMIGLIEAKLSKKNTAARWFNISHSVDVREHTESYLYLMSRGIKDTHIERYNIRYPFFTSRRVIFPNIFYKGWTDMYVARSIVPWLKPKYKNPKNAPAKEIVFNLHNIDTGPPYIIINEGVINSIISGIKGVAIYGKMISDTQYKALAKKKAKKYYVSLDSDAMKQAIDLCERITNKGGRALLVELPEGKDAADLRGDYINYLKKAKVYKSSFYSLPSRLKEPPERRLPIYPTGKNFRSKLNVAKAIMKKGKT